LLAIPVVVGLFMVMHSLIDRDFENPEVSNTKIAELVQPDEEIQLETAVKKPDKVEDPEEPPPEMEMAMIDLNMDADIANVAPTAKVDISISTSGMSSGDGEYLPIVKVAPIYPRRAQTRGITGYCIVEYTVTTSGAIRDPVAVDCQPSGVFEKASVKAATKFKYKPRVVDGEAIEVAGVQNKFTYELEE
jgi:protein TonB